MSGVDNLNYMYSLNAAGNGQMTMIVDFDVKSDPEYRPDADADARDAGRLAAAAGRDQLRRDGAEIRDRAADGDGTVIRRKGTYDGKFLANYSYINLNDQLTRVPGIGNVQVFGAGQYAMRLWVKPDQLAKLGITVTEVVSAIQAQNTVNPAGQVGGSPSPKGQEYTYSVRAQGRLTSPEEFGDIIVRETAGRRHRARARCGAHRTGRAGLHAVGPHQRQAGRDYRGLSTARHQRGGRRARASAS